MELESSSSSGSALLEHEGVATSVAEGASVEGVAAVPLLLVGVGVVAAVEAGAQLGVAQDLVRLVDGRHLLLGRLLGEPLLGRLVRVVLLGELAIGRLDLALVGVVRHAQNLVVVLCLGSLECDLGLLHQRVDHVALVRPALLGLLKRVDAGFVLLGLELHLGLLEKAVEGLRIKRQGLLAVFGRLFAV